MVDFYLKRIDKRLMEPEDVPNYWRSEVEAKIKKESEGNEEDGAGKLH
jgi:hypothetical protein